MSQVTDHTRHCFQTRNPCPKRLWPSLLPYQAEPTHGTVLQSALRYKPNPMPDVGRSLCYSLSLRVNPEQPSRQSTLPYEKARVVLADEGLALCVHIRRTPKWWGRTGRFPDAGAGRRTGQREKAQGHRGSRTAAPAGALSAQGLADTLISSTCSVSTSIRLGTSINLPVVSAA